MGRSSKDIMRSADPDSNYQSPVNTGRPVAKPGRATKSAVDAYEASAARENKSRAATGGQQTTPATSAQGSTPAPTSAAKGTGADIANGINAMMHLKAKNDQAIDASGA